MGTLSLEAATRGLCNLAESNSGGLPRFKKIVKRGRRSVLVLGSEAAAGAAAYVLSAIVLSQSYGAVWERGMLRFAGAASVSAALLASFSTRLYQRSLRHASILDVRALATALVVNASFLTAFLYLNGTNPRLLTPFIVLDSAVLFAAWGLLHFGSRLWQAHRASQRKSGARAVIIGAGDAGLAILKALALDRASSYRPVALADDDTRKWGRTLFGVPVLGGLASLARIASQTRADAILVCVPSATHLQMHQILGVCRRLNLPVRSLPSLPELIQGVAGTKVSPRHLREPRIEYLLQRDKFEADASRTRSLIEGKTVLVTGAGGSIGAELAREVSTANPKRLLLLDKSENSLFYAHLEMAERLGTECVRPILADLSADGRTRSILKAERPDLVFHAAAYKHVSMIELHPEEAIRNNVLGTRNLAEASLECGVSSFVNVSTDKAVEPSNFMGLSKKLTELCVQEFARQASISNAVTRFSNVRFGNVAGSTGSVIRLFWEQIQRGGPIRVTDPQASRYFMSISEAVHLILGAAELGRDGETFVFEMGEPFNIYELAKTMALFSGLRPHRDIAIEFAGLRKGEKLTERLWSYWERPASTSTARILAIRDKDPRSRGILTAVREMERSLACDDPGGIMPVLGKLFPEFGDPGKINRRHDGGFPRTGKLALAGPLEAA